jgi:hypothetical protein
MVCSTGGMTLTANNQSTTGSITGQTILVQEPQLDSPHATTHLHHLHHCQYTTSSDATAGKIHTLYVGKQLSGMANQLAALIPNRTAMQRDVLKRPTALHALQSHTGTGDNLLTGQQHNPQHH